MGMSDAVSLPSSDHESSLGRRSRWRVLLWLGGIFLLLLSIIPISWAVIRWRTNQAIAAEMDRIRAAGEPASFEDVIDSIPPLAPEQDCTQMYDEVFAIITSQLWERRASALPYIGDGEADESSIPPPGVAWPGLDAAAKFIDGESYNLMTLDKAAALGGQCRFPLTASDLKNVAIERTGFKSRSARALIQLRADVAAHHRDSQEVMKSLRSLAALVECQTLEPDMVSLLYQSANNQALNDHVVRMLGYGLLDDEQLAALQTIARSFSYRQQLRNALLCERLFIAMEFDGTKPTLDLGDEYSDFTERPPWWWRFTSHVDAWEYWTRMREICDATTDEDQTQMLQRLSSIEDAMAAFVGSSTWQQRYYYTADAVGVSKQFAIAAVSTETRNRLLDAILACERHRLVHDVYPQSLGDIATELLPAVPIDPFSGNPIRLQLNEAGVVVYSVGSDGKDDGGEARSDDLRYRSNSWKRTYEESRTAAQEINTSP